jgi:hypothetical protein
MAVEVSGARLAREAVWDTVVLSGLVFVEGVGGGASGAVRTALCAYGRTPGDTFGGHGGGFIRHARQLGDGFSEGCTRLVRCLRLPHLRALDHALYDDVRAAYPDLSDIASFLVEVTNGIDVWIASRPDGKHVPNRYRGDVLLADPENRRLIKVSGPIPGHY